ncbi:mechanosensitive ion channel protein MscS [Sulfitobacter porphyrae]|nr:mechanosensitive ion channel protein MscS [Sulfitobacter porphyrae]
MGRFARLFTRLAIVLCLIAGAASAQDSTLSAAVPNFDRWEPLARAAENAIEQKRGTDATLEAMRGRIAEYRGEFDNARSINAARIKTLREQIAALGPAPDEATAEAEPPDVAAQRTALNDELSSLLVPVQRAETQYVRANSLVGQLDAILRERQTRQLLTVTPSPLNPAYWRPALVDLTTALEGLRNESPKAANARTWSSLRENLPVVVVLTVLGLVLILRGRYWAGMIVRSLQKYGARGFGIWRFVVSLLRIFLPASGLIALALAIISSDLLGPKGESIVLVISFLGGMMLGVRWVSERAFSRDDDEALLLLSQDKRKEARFHVSMITVMIVITELVGQILDNSNSAAVSRSVLVFPWLVVSSLMLYRIGVLLRGYVEPSAATDDALTEVRISTFGRVVRGLGTGAVVIGGLSPILLAAGYFKAVDALMPPYIMTLVLLGLVMVLQRFLAELYGVLTGQGAAARDALMPVLFGMILLLLALPVLALVWGARVTELTELWQAFGRGFAVGDTRISPTDFLSFAVIFVIGYAVTRLVQSALRSNVLPKTKIDIGGQNAIVSGLGYFGIFLAALAAITGAGIDLSSLAFVAGALSLGIGFGLQNIVSNFVSGIILLIERPISEGDWIEVGGQMGYVRDISVRSTRIETFDRTDVIVPNADLVSGTVTNYTRGNTVGRLIVPVGVAYGTDTRRVDKLLREIAEAQPMVLGTPPPNVLFMNFGADALEFEIRCFLRDVNWMMVVKNEINHQIAERFAKEGIEIPFAQRDLWLRNPEVLSPRRGAADEVASTETAEKDIDLPEVPEEGRTAEADSPDDTTA